MKNEKNNLFNIVFTIKFYYFIICYSFYNGFFIVIYINRIINFYNLNNNIVLF